MTKRVIILINLIMISGSIFAQAPNEKSGNKDSNLNQYYSGKFGFYNPGNGLNNGLILGIDGITEFKKYNFFLSGDIDLYQKKTIDIFSDPKPDVTDQMIFLIPLHINFGYKLLEIPDADTKFYAGLGGGYYLYFYSVTYSGNSGGLFGGLTSNSDSKSGGNIFFSVFGRILIGKIFVEPRYYIASKKVDNTGGYSFTINPSGFAITLGFQY
ncbi:MAG: hypothetical protein M1480_05025 [Bacteroidetes bacterium]|nr:hypothetical protein [Bacteroidota bacterium]